MSNKDVWSAFNKAFDSVALRGDEVPKNNNEVISFPSLSLGDATHYWGVPKGMITQFHGPEGSGKTFLAMIMVKQAQDQFKKGDVVWFDAEFSFNRKWAQKIGIDLSRLRIIPGNNAAQIFTMMCGISNDKGTKTTLGILDHVANGDLECPLIVLDSIANLIPPVEENRGFEEQEMSPLARFLPKGFRRASEMLSKTNTAMICINQAREKIGERVPTLTYPGGRAYRHSLSLVVRLQASTSKDNWIFSDAEKEKKVGHKVIATVEKTRGGPDKYKAEFWLDFGKGIVHAGEEAALLGAAYGVVERPNAQNWKYKDLAVRGKDAFFAALESNPALISSIIDEVKELKNSGAERSVALSDDAKTVVDYASEGD